MPVVGVGLLYQQGYFRQVIDEDGEQQALFPYNDPGQLPDHAGARARRRVAAAGDRAAGLLGLAARLAGPGRAGEALPAGQQRPGQLPRRIAASPASSTAAARSCASSRSWSSGSAAGGCCSALGLRPEVCHLNEGHAAFAVLERARSFMEETGQPFEVALTVTRAGNLFTTHTAGRRRVRPLRPRPRRAVPRRIRREGARHRPRRSAGAGPPGSGRRVGTLQHGVPGHPRQRRGQRREPPARRR